MPPARSGDAAQYVLASCKSTRRISSRPGKNVLIAVIDSEIDAKHPDLDGAVVKSFDALGGSEKPHPHGTVDRRRHCRPRQARRHRAGPQILAVHAFDDTPGEAKGTSFAIYKGLQWAADNSRASSI